MALAYARYLHCSAPTEADACGKCSSCIQYDTLQHPDLHWSFPFFRKDGSDHALSQPFQAAWRERLLQGPYFGQEEWLAAIGADRKQLFISVQEAMELNRKLGLKAFAGGWKVLILWLPEAMRVDTANKMLKLKSCGVVWRLKKMLQSTNKLKIYSLSLLMYVVSGDTF